MNLCDRTLTALNRRADIASLVAFRIGFGLTALWWALDYLCRGQVTALYVLPRFHFSYRGLDWIRPWPGAGPYLHFVALALFAFCIAIGLLYRAAAVLFALGFTLFFCWDRTNYQNHYYLLLLLSWLLPLLPLNGAVSLDVVDSPQIATSAVPRWMLWLVRFHIALPYVYGGLAKIDSDWLAGAGLRDYLVTKASWPVLGHWLASPSGAVALAWCGLAFDLGIVPLLLWKRTRIAAYVLAVAFHLANHFLFSIHVFPWFMIMATTVFLDPGWPRRLSRQTPVVAAPAKPVHWSEIAGATRLRIGLLTLYLATQIVLPQRYRLYSGDIGWHERGHYFSWRMMLRTKRSALRIYMTDPSTLDTWNVDLRDHLHPNQITRCACDPEMILELAHLLRDDRRQTTGRTPEVRALVLICYNGRRPQLFIDPQTNLAAEPRNRGARDWLLPQREPIPETPWNRPLEEWQQSVTLPPLPKITRGPHGEKAIPAGSLNRPSTAQIQPP